MGLHRIYCQTIDGNIGMVKLAEKLGMLKEGVRRQHMMNNDQHCDVLEFGILKEEWK